jgi:membrane-bound inhibitor of C-type lysozyme
MFVNKIIKIRSNLNINSLISYISYAKLSNISNKRITRISSDTKVSKSELKTECNETSIQTKLINRNPRNLEQLLFEQKTLGFELDLPQRHFWNKF